MEREAGWLHAGSALIRSVLNLDPDTLGDEEWGYQVKMAVWAERHRAECTGRILAAHIADIISKILKI